MSISVESCCDLLASSFMGPLCSQGVCSVQSMLNIQPIHIISTLFLISEPSLSNLLPRYQSHMNVSALLDDRSRRQSRYVYETTEAGASSEKREILSHKGYSPIATCDSGDTW